MTTLKVLLMASREFAGRTPGKKFSACSLLDVEHGKHISTSVPVELLADAGIEGPSMSAVLLMKLDTSMFPSRVAGFEKTQETYQLPLVS